MKTITAWVPGEPIQQGSKNTGRHGQMYDAKGPKLKAWRQKIAYTLRGAEKITGPVTVEATFHLTKPPTTKFPDAPAGPPDLDKLQRALGDALTQAQVIEDDARITQWATSKQWATTKGPGLQIHITPRTPKNL